MMEEEKCSKMAGSGNDEEEAAMEIPDLTGYFASYEDLNVHRLMLQDKVRTEAYINAVTNGGTLFKDKVVMDVGAGTGILSMICAKAGASRVYAVEASNLASVLPKVIAKNGFENVIKVIHSRVEDISEIDEGKVDIIISEWMGFYLLHESMLDSVLIARDKFLKPGGHMFPNSAQIYAAPCSVPDVYQSRVEFWSEEQKQYGFDFSPFQDIARNVGEPLIEEVPQDGVMSDPQLLFDFNLETVEKQALQELKDRRFLSIEQEGDVHGVCIWFSCTFPAVPEKEPVTLCTAPWSPQTHWKQTVILFPSKLTYELGDIFGWEIKLEKSQEPGSRQYSIDFQCLDPESDEHPVPCECGMIKCEIVKEYMSQQELIA